MPNRIIKESICASEDLNALSSGAEILFYRLIVKADDFGIYYGNPQLVKNACFPLKTDKELKESQVEGWLCELAQQGLIYWYKAQDGRNYLQFAKWANHQRTRANQSKYPPFNDECCQLLSSAVNCCQMSADDSKCLQMSSNTITKTKTKTKTGSGTAQAQPTREEVREYAKSRNSPVDPDRFYDFYTADDDPEKHWIDSKGHPVANWKQKLISWEMRETDAGRSNHSSAEDSTTAGAEKWGNLYS